MKTQKEERHHSSLNWWSTKQIRRPKSNLNWGSQSIPENLQDLQYGVSVTDACIDWDTTEKAIMDMHAKLKDVLPNR